MPSFLRPPLLVAALLLAPAAAPAQPPAGDAAAPQPPAGALDEARRLVTVGDYRDAIAAAEGTDPLAAGRCGECQLVVAEASLHLLDRPAAIAAARAALAGLAEPARIGWAKALLAGALAQPCGTPGELAEAEGAARRALALGNAITVRYAREVLGNALLLEKRYDALVSEGRAFLAENPYGVEADTERRLVCAARALGHVAGPEPVPCPASRDARTERPHPIFRPQPGYTESALAAGIRGPVVAEAIVDEEGCVADARIKTGLASDLDLAVLDTLRYWTFHPATFGEKPIRTTYTLTVNFAAPDPGLAALRGTVKDPRQDFGLPGVTIELRSPALREPRVVVSNAYGDFVVRDLPPGRYTVTTKLEGYGQKSFEVDLAAGKTARLDAQMEGIGEVVCNLTPPVDQP